MVTESGLGSMLSRVGGVPSGHVWTSISGGHMGSPAHRQTNKTEKLPLPLCRHAVN